MAYNEINNIDSPNFTSGRGGKKVDRIVIHWWDDPARNPSAEGVVATLTNPSRQASAHYVITGTGRRAWCLVAESDTAWHAGDFDINQRSIGLECDPRCRAEDYDVVAEVIADLWRYYGKIPLTPHRQYSSTACPGNYDLNRLKREAEAKLNPPKPTPVPVTVKSTQSFAAKIFIVKEDTKLVNIPADTQYNYTVYKKGSKVEDVVELITASNGKTFYRTKYARDTAKKMYGYKGSVLEEEKKPVTPPVVPEPKPPVVEPPVVTPPATDWGEKNNVLLNKLVEMVQWIIDKLKGVFK